MASPADGLGGKRLSPYSSRRLTEITASGITGRGPSCLCTDDLWQGAVDLIGRSGKIAILSGFYVPSAMSPETDGVGGSCALASALFKMGRDVEIWTDSLCISPFELCASELKFPRERVVDASRFDGGGHPPDLFIYIERAGRAADGAYYNMRSVDISRWTAPLDSHAILNGLPVIAIGDGGNEVGMGSLLEPLTALLPEYKRCLCVVASDICIPVDVSDWGAYALTAALSLSFGEWLGPSESEELKMMDALLDSGAVDGVTGRRERSVDGLGEGVHLKIRSDLENLVSAAR
jgi:hypothetical protein